MAELAPGDIFAGHRIEGVAGRGGFGVVYRATHLALDHVVALKLISSERAADPTFRERFQSESRIAVSIRHPNVVAVHHAGEEDGLLFVTMDFIEGTDLRGLLNREGRLEPREATPIIAPVASALDAAHERGLVHRDIKPGNVLIEERSGERHVFLTDFGLSKKIDATSGVTASGAFVGTLDYVAPEQIKGDRVDARTDVYALGCVLYELLTGEVPFGGGTEKVAKMYAHLQEAPPPLSEKAPDAPSALGDVVWRAMEKDPERRFPSAGDLARAATAAAEGRRPSEPERNVGVGAAAPTRAFDALGAGVAGADTETAEAAAPPRPPRKSSARARLLGGLVAAAVVAGGAVLLLSGGDDGGATARVVGVPIRVPENPVSIAVGEGGDLFVSSNEGRKVVRIDRDEPEVADRFDLAGNGKQLAIAEDDGSVWASSGEAGSGSAGNVVELDPGTLAEVQPFTVGTDPRGIALDDEFAWVANYGSNTVSRIGRDASGTETFESEGIRPARVTRGADSIWVSNAGSGTVTRLRKQGEQRDAIEVGDEGSEPRGMVFADARLWVALSGEDAITAIDPAKGEAGEHLPDVRIEVGEFPLSLAFGFGSLWVTNRDEDTVSRIDPNAETDVETISVERSPGGIAVDEERVWVALGREGEGQGEVVEIDPNPSD